jgi:hypothetical protein
VSRWTTKGFIEVPHDYVGSWFLTGAREFGDSIYFLLFSRTGSLRPVPWSIYNFYSSAIDHIKATSKVRMFNLVQRHVSCGAMHTSSRGPMKLCVERALSLRRILDELSLGVLRKRFVGVI